MCVRLVGTFAGFRCFFFFSTAPGPYFEKLTVPQVHFYDSHAEPGLRESVADFLGEKTYGLSIFIILKRFGAVARRP